MTVYCAELTTWYSYFNVSDLLCNVDLENDK